VIVVVIDAVLVLSALAALALLLCHLRDNKISFKDSKEDWFIVALISLVLLGKLIQWCTPWL